MTDDFEDDQARKRRLAPSSEHQRAAQQQAEDYLEDILKKADLALRDERQRSAAVRSELTPEQARHPDYRELLRTHQTVVATSQRQQSREQGRAPIESVGPERTLTEDGSRRKLTAISEIKRAPQGNDQLPQPDIERSRGAASEVAHETSRQQDEQSKSAERKATLREQGIDAPVEKMAEVKAERTQIAQRRAPWGEEFRTTSEERAAVETSQNMQQSKGLGRAR
jgi:hypothetical protein